MKPKSEIKIRNKQENRELTQLALEILRHHNVDTGRLSPLGPFGAVAPRVVEIIGTSYSGCVKKFMRHHKSELLLWCQERQRLAASTIQPKIKETAKIAEASKVEIKPKPKKKLRATEHSVKTYIKKYSGVDPTSDEFLSTFEWKALRMMALKRYSPVCQCCGSTPASGAIMNVDHIKPRKLFPHLALDIENLQVLCSDCNIGKGNWDMTDWRK